MKQTVDYKYLNFVQFSSIDSWSIYAILGKGLVYTNKYPFVEIGKFLKRNKTQVEIQNGVIYKRPTIKINAKGITLRDEVDGINIGTKNQFRIKEGQFLLSKIDARNGAFGVVPKELDNGIITGNFWTFDVDYSKINPVYLMLLTGTKEFQKLSQSASVGTTNRNYLQEKLFLNFKIPLPSLAEQEAIVKAYQTKIQQAQDLEQQAQNLEQEIEKYFLNELGLEPYKSKEKIRGLMTIDFQDLERWDYFSSDIMINQEINKSKFPLVKIGSVFSFVKRSFNKNKYKKETFEYIEIGAIDPIKGILKSKKVLASKAPSRATQYIKSNDLIIGTTRPYLKKFAIVTDKHDNSVCSSGFSVIEESNNYFLPYLLQFLKCTYGIEQLKNKMTGGLYPAITEGELKEIKIPFPNVAKQKEIMSLVKKKEKEIKDNILKNIQLKHQAEQEFEQALFN
ncbi:restriction endonuclease subunit S [Riemerella columbipharyngis]|uniref:Type I restriction enzyme, S subunit/type I restriction enzyme M protein n=1 Tax=Riemerella columbipharyngis TaxID=1071918 RepID=A0A1G6ZTN1_9FLAO|nr:restriction endonuclease subunit S [Riemerella columbipharyngis]SDE05860.1 type I restriction enzyme, S subunit/type I restriction enzyme M protein [Riemerella columbipharyngis]